MESVGLGVPCQQLWIDDECSSASLSSLESLSVSIAEDRDEDRRTSRSHDTPQCDNNKRMALNIRRRKSYDDADPCCCLLYTSDAADE